MGTGGKKMPKNNYRILVINPGSTSTKIGVFNNDELIFERSMRHESNFIGSFKKIIDQFEFRIKIITETLFQEGFDLSAFDAICGRGGLLRPIEGGTYIVNQMMLEDLKQGYAGQHASNLGGIIAYHLSTEQKIPAYIVDPVVVDELQPIARISGSELFERKSIFHALNQKAVARRVANRLNRQYEEMRLIVVHMGGGITVGVHKYGKVIDVNNGLHGEGPFSPERAGTVPIGDLVSLCFSGKYYFDELMKKLVGEGGLVDYLGTNDAITINKMIDQGDEKAQLIYDAMAYQVAKEIGAASTVLNGNIDLIILTGGLAHDIKVVEDIKQHIQWIAEVVVEPGENELQALAEGALRVLRGEEQAKEYRIIDNAEGQV